MKVVLFQLPVVLSDFEGNKKLFLDKLAQETGKEETIIVFPEMWSCGFDYKNLSIYAERTDEVISEIQSIIDDNTMVVTTHPEKKSEQGF